MYQTASDQTLSAQRPLGLAWYLLGTAVAVVCNVWTAGGLPDVTWLRERTKVPACTLAAPRWARAPRFVTFKTMKAFMLQRDAARVISLAQTVC